MQTMLSPSLKNRPSLIRRSSTIGRFAGIPVTLPTRCFSFVRMNDKSFLTRGVTIVTPFAFFVRSTIYLGILSDFTRKSAKLSFSYVYLYDVSRFLYDMVEATKIITPITTTKVIARNPVSYTHLRAHETRHDLV